MYAHLWGHSLPFYSVQEFGACAKVGNFIFFEDIPQMADIGEARRTVRKHDGGPGCQTAYEPVPHHPTAGGEVK